MISSVEVKGSLMVINFQGCNLDCKWCKCPDLIIHPEDKFFRTFDFISDFEVSNMISKQGIESVKISGGEALSSSGIIDFIEQLKEEFGLNIHLVTNGTYSDKLSILVDENLVDKVTLSFKVNDDKFEHIAKDGYKSISAEKYSINLMSSIETLANNDVDSEYKITVVPGIHTKQDIETIGRLIGKNDKLIIENYKSTAEIRNNICDLPWNGFTEKKLKYFRKFALNYTNNVEIRSNQYVS